MSGLDLYSCVDFTRYGGDQNWGSSEFRLGWFKFTWNGPRQPYISVDFDGVHALSFHRGGLNIAVAEPVRQITVTTESRFTLNVTVLDIDGNVISRQDIPGGRSPKTSDFTFDNLGKISFGASRSARVLNVCIPPVDFSARIQQEIEEAIQSNPALAPYLTGENSAQFLNQLLNFLSGSSPSDGEEPDGNGGGEDGFWPSSWPPDWNCFFKNVAGLIVATALVVAAGYFLGPGVLTISEFIIAELVKLGFSQSVATALTYVVGGTAFAVAFAGRCE